jgi:hypothetical protein
MFVLLRVVPPLITCAQRSINSAEGTPKEGPMATINPGKLITMPEVKPTPAGPPHSWSPQFWSNRQLVGLQFPNPEGLDALIEQFWTDPVLEGLPRVYVGDNTVIIPAAVVTYLRQQGHSFTARPVVSAGDLPAEEVNEIRRCG